jgi:hypothetical protein
VAVTLHVFRGELEEETLETSTDETGQFRFEGLDTDATLEYWPEAVHLGVSYSPAEPLAFSSEDSALSATITVYETTEDDSSLVLSSVHMIAESFGEVLRISEIHLYGNSGDRTFIGGAESAPAGTTVFVPLPSQAVGIAYGEGVAPDRYVEVDGGVMDKEPVVPGAESSLTFLSYHLMVSGSAVPLERTFAYPVSSLNMLVAQPGLTLRSEQLVSMGTESFQDRQYELFVAQPLDAGEPLLADLVPSELAGDPAVGGMPSASPVGGAGSSTRGNQGVLLWLGAALAFLAVLGAAIVPQVTRKPVKPRRQLRLASDPTTRPLIVELADLQEAFDKGELDQVRYEQERARIYEELRSV